MENKNYIWRPVSEYTGGRVLATNGLDVLIGEINSEGDCESEEGGSTILCGITGFIKIEEMLPELKESEGERIRENLITFFKDEYGTNSNARFAGIKVKDILAWLKTQGDTFTKKDIDDAYLKGICDAKKELEKQSVQKPAEWSEEDESMRTRCIGILGKCYMGELPTKVEEELNWLKSLKYRYTWVPSEEQMIALKCAITTADEKWVCMNTKDLESLYQDLKKLKG